MLFCLHSRLAIRSIGGGDAAAVPSLSLWYALRGLDRAGSGRVEVSAAELRALTGRSQSTLWRWLDDRRIIWRHRSAGRGRYVIYYRSLARVCISLGVGRPGSGGLGAVAWTNSAQDLAGQAAYIAAQSLQAQSMWLAAHPGPAGRSNPPVVVIKPEVYFDPEGRPLLRKTQGSRDAVRGKTRGLVRFDGRDLVVLARDVVPYGASIAGVARALGVGWTTAQRLLADAAGPHRVQMVRPTTWTEWSRAQFEQAERAGLGPDADAGGPGGFLFTMPGARPRPNRPNARRPAKLMTYRYYPMYVLCRQRDARQEVARAWAAHLGMPDPRLVPDPLTPDDICQATWGRAPVFPLDPWAEGAGWGAA